MESDGRQFLPLTEATFFILASLTSPKHGYAIMQDLSTWSDGKTRLGPGTLYGALTKLLDQGLIRRVEDPSPADDRRKSYVLTPLGLRVVEAECARLESAARLGRTLLNGKEL
jgi:DNA-binding PadR family transcriptional regulator